MKTIFKYILLLFFCFWSVSSFAAYKTDYLTVTENAKVYKKASIGKTVTPSVTLDVSGNVKIDYTENIATADGTHYFDITVTGAKDPAGSAEVSGLYSAYNWTSGTNGAFVANAIEGVARSRSTDEAGTFRGILGRVYVDPSVTGSATARTAVGIEASARASYSGGAEMVAESGTAFVGQRIWMAPYFSSDSVDNINNFWGLWIYGEHPTSRNADAAIKISDAGGGFRDDIILQSGDGITNAVAGTITTNAILTVPTVNATSLGGTLSTASQPNITSIGTLLGLTISGTTTTDILIATTANITTITGTISTANYASTANYSNDSDKLDAQQGSYYLDASNINAGTLGSAYLSGSYTITSSTANALSSYDITVSTANYAVTSNALSSYDITVSSSNACLDINLAYKNINNSFSVGQTISGDVTANNAIFQGDVTVNRLLAGSNSNYTDYPNVIVNVSNGNTGHTYTGFVSLVGEAVSDGTDTATGVGGVATTSGNYWSRGIAGVGKVNNTADTGTAVGVYARALDSHTGGTNIGLVGAAQNGNLNYSVYGQYGWLYNADYVGIATPNPTEALSVSGNALITGSVTGNSAYFVTVTGTPTFTGDLKISSQKLGSSTYDSMNDFVNSFGSTGRKTGGLITNVSDATINVTAGTGFIKASDDDNAQLMFCDWAASDNITIPSSSVRYIGVDYNGGSPVVVAHTSFDWDLDSQFPLGRVVNETINGADEIYILNNPWWVTDGITNTTEAIRSFGLLRRDETVGGLILSTTGTRCIAVSAGTVWSGLVEFPFTAINTNVAGSIESYWYKSGEGWQESATENFSVTQWNDVTQTTLQTIGANKYCNVWIYLEMNQSTPSICLIYPQAQYNTAAEAEAKSAPDNIPQHISSMGVLIGRFIIKQGTNTPISTQSAFATKFSASVVTSHSNLTDLEADTHTQYSLVDGTRAFTGSISAPGATFSGTSTSNTIVCLVTANITNLNVTNNAVISCTANVSTLNAISTTINVVGTLNVSGDIVTLGPIDFDDVQVGGVTSNVLGWATYSERTIIIKKVGATVTVYFALEGTSNDTVCSFTVPWNSRYTMNIQQASAYDNTTALDPNGVINLTAGSSTVTISKSRTSAAWTNSGGKITRGEFQYFTE